MSFVSNPVFLLSFVLILLAWLIFLSALILKFLKQSQILTKGTSQLNELIINSEKIGDLDKTVTTLTKENMYNIHKIGLVRFNPFSETGGDQSFSLAILDHNNDGFVLSGLHNRDTTRVYAKPVKQGEALDYELSNEEKKAIKDATRTK
jgi:hypothetical protein